MFVNKSNVGHRNPVPASFFGDECILLSRELRCLNRCYPFVGYTKEVQHLRHVFLGRSGRTTCLPAIHPD